MRPLIIAYLRPLGWQKQWRLWFRCAQKITPWPVLLFPVSRKVKRSWFSYLQVVSSFLFCFPREYFLHPSILDLWCPPWKEVGRLLKFVQHLYMHHMISLLNGQEACPGGITTVTNGITLVTNGITTVATAWSESWDKHDKHCMKSRSRLMQMLKCIMGFTKMFILPHIYVRFLLNSIMTPPTGRKEAKAF